MLQAKTEYGKSVTLASLAKSEIALLKEKEKFSCPTCNNPVIVKAGPQMIPHFAHRSKSSCPAHEGGEGVYHEKGKLVLYQWLKHQRLDVQLEVYLPEIRQRPDILIRLNNKTIAIEYQCARVPVEQINKRNEGYHSLGITPIWILGARHLERRNQSYLKIDQFQLHFIHQFSSVLPLTLFYFCPNTLRFILFQDIYFSNARMAIGKFHTKKLNKLVFTELFSKQFFSEIELYHLWKREKRKFRIKPLRYLYGLDLEWHQWLYQKRTHQEHLPSIIHLPVPAQYLMNTPPWNWQSRLVLEIINPLTIGERFSLSACNQLLSHQLNHPKAFTLIKPVESPIYQYLQLLELLNIISQESSGYFTKLKPILFYKNIDDALDGDDMLLNLLMAGKIRA